MSAEENEQQIQVIEESVKGFTVPILGFWARYAPVYSMRKGQFGPSTCCIVYYKFLFLSADIWWARICLKTWHSRSSLLAEWWGDFSDQLLQKKQPGKAWGKKRPQDKIYFAWSFPLSEMLRCGFLLLCKHLERYNYVYSKSQSHESWK